MRRIGRDFLLHCLTVLVCGVTCEAQEGATRGEWPHSGGGKGFTRYSSLDQIDKDTVMDLRIAWRRPALTDEFRAQYPDVMGGSPSVFQSTPIMVNGVLYASNGIGLVEALDPATGETLWVQELEEEGEEALAGEASRGVTFWRSGTDERILSVRRHYLIATDAKTGKLIRGFGDGGKVDLRYYADASEPFDSYRWRSAPIVIGDVVVVGSAVRRAGDVRGYDLNSGRLRWTFGVIPGPDDFGGDTWLGDSWKGISAGEADVWSMMSADEELGLVYLPTSAPTNNMYGGHRPGANLFSSSIICVRADTGERVWHFQTVHHDIFDYDNPTPPILIDITVSGRPIKPGFPIWPWYSTARTSRRALISGAPT